MPSGRLVATRMLDVVAPISVIGRVGMPLDANFASDTVGPRGSRGWRPCAGQAAVVWAVAEPEARERRPPHPP